jgi:hypothetical protein
VDSQALTNLKKEVLQSSERRALSVQDPVSKIDPLARYIPADAKAFLVEDFRLNDSERVSQRISTLAPWFIFLGFVVSPFIVMKYNLDRLGSKKDVDSGKQIRAHARYPFKRINYKSVPEILERRFPTFLLAASDNFQSQVIGLFVRELDSLLASHGVDISVCVMDFDSADAIFKSKYHAAPLGQLIIPGGDMVEFPGPWSLRDAIDFLLPSDRVTEAMVSDIRESESKLLRFRKCLFRRRFVKLDRTWSLSDSISENTSLDSSLNRCESAEM